MGKKKSGWTKFKEKLDMYDMILANLIAGNSLIEPSQKLNNSQIAIGFSNISSADYITKYFMLSRFPDYIPTELISILRGESMNPGVKINFYFHSDPHRINWDSPEMKNKMAIWKKYSEENSGPTDVFAYRNRRDDILARERIMTSTRYLNEAELDYKRSLLRTYFIITISAKRNEEDILNMIDSIDNLKRTCKRFEIRLSEIRVNMIDWLRVISPFSLKRIKEIDSKISRKIITDDILANLNSYKQGRVGDKGVPLGIDVLSGTAVLRKFKEDPNGADNWLISAVTGGGKSLWLKVLMTYLLAEGFVCCIMDYEGDEYLNIANYVKAGNPDDVKIISMGKGSNIYFDPCEIPDLTGDPLVDDELKESAISFIFAIFRLIVCGTEDDFTREQEKVMSLAVQRMYDTAGVTDDKNTWHRSKGLRLHDVYRELKELVETKELVDSDADNLKHKAAVAIVDSASVYFEPGEAKSGAFKNPMSANSLYKCKMIVFSFGMKGADTSAEDPIILGLKQLSVAYVNIKISNYCKYVRKCFNIKVWEEFQRWGSVRGSASTIGNAITGGRKRGDVNFIITNDLAAMLDDNNELNKTLRQNIQNYAIGSIPDKSVREEFCEKFDLKDCRIALDTIAKTNKRKKTGAQKLSGADSKYKNAFCISLETGERVIVKARVPKTLLKSSLFKTGVDIGDRKE